MQLLLVVLATAMLAAAAATAAETASSPDYSPMSLHCERFHASVSKLGQKCEKHYLFFYTVCNYNCIADQRLSITDCYTKFTDWNTYPQCHEIICIPAKGKLGPPAANGILGDDPSKPCSSETTAVPATNRNSSNVVDPSNESTAVPATNSSTAKAVEFSYRTTAAAATYGNSSRTESSAVPAFHENSSTAANNSSPVTQSYPTII